MARKPNERLGLCEEGQITLDFSFLFELLLFTSNYCQRLQSKSRGKDNQL